MELLIIFYRKIVAQFIINSYLYETIGNMYNHSDTNDKCGSTEVRSDTLFHIVMPKNEIEKQECADKQHNEAQFKLRPSQRRFKGNPL